MTDRLQLRRSPVGPQLSFVLRSHDRERPLDAVTDGALGVQLTRAELRTLRSLIDQALGEEDVALPAVTAEQLAGALGDLVSIAERVPLQPWGETEWRSLGAFVAAATDLLAAYYGPRP